MAVKTPAERAVADVEKAIKTHDTALEKAEAAQRKADELVAKANRADRELQWYSRHPDLPDNFDLDEFRRSLEAPFDEGGELEPGSGEAVNDTDEDEPVVAPDAPVVGEGTPEPDAPSVAGDSAVASTDSSIGAADADDEDPWADQG